MLATLKGRKPRSLAMLSRGQRVVAALAVAGFLAGLTALALPVHGRTSERPVHEVSCGRALSVFLRDDPRAKLANLERMVGPQRTADPKAQVKRYNLSPAFLKLLADASSFGSCAAGARKRVELGGALLFSSVFAALAASLVMRMPSGRRSVRFGVAMALTAWTGLALRVAYVGAYSRHRGLGFDAWFYSLGWKTFGGSSPSALFPPGWGAVVGAASALGLDSNALKMLVGSAIGTASIVLVGLLGRRIGGRTVGIVAAGLAALWPFLVASDGSLMAESLYVALLLTLLLSLPRPGQHASPGRWAVVGFVLGAAVLTRGEAVLLLPLLIVPTAYRHREGSLRRFLGLVGIAAAATAAVLLPWAARNYIVFHEPVWLSDNSSTVVAGANCDKTYHGPGRGFWLIECLEGRYTPAERHGKVFNEVTSNNRVRDEGIRYAREHASELPVLAGVRLLRTWGFYSPFPQMRNEALIEVRSYDWLVAGWMLNLLVLPLAVWGAWDLRRRRANTWPLLSLIVMVSTTSVLTYGIQRFRLAAEPAILVLAAAGATSLARSVWGRSHSSTGRESEAHGIAGSMASPDGARFAETVTGAAPQQGGDIVGGPPAPGAHQPNPPPS